MSAELEWRVYFEEEEIDFFHMVLQERLKTTKNKVLGKAF